jgi:hypothetical protein
VDQAAGLAAMIPSPRRINPRTNPSLHARATRKVLRQMRWAGYLRRDIRDMGNEPEKIAPDESGPEPREQDDPPTPPPTPTPVPTPTGAQVRLSPESGPDQGLGLSTVSMIEFPA